jgi:hypothetical protein
MLALAFLIAVIYMSSKLVKRGTTPTILDDLIKETHKYSGMSEVLYREFLANVNMAREYSAHEDISRKLLKRGLVNLEDLALEYTAGDTSVIDEIHVLIVKINAEFENTYRRT